MTHTGTILLIRHGKTAGNLAKRYIGRTDEPLCPEGIAALREISYPSCDMVIASPMVRCRQTAAILYPHRPMRCYDGLRECDFGDFEGKTYRELSDNPDYIKWINSNGTLPFPHGEAHDDFKRRCISAFDRAIAENTFDTAAFVVHGGTIMAILEAYAFPQRAFYDYQVKNGHGFVTTFKGHRLHIISTIQGTIDL